MALEIPTAGEVRKEVWATMRDIEKLGCWDEHTESIDVRLQVEQRGWRILWGDPSFDLDHSGVWGYSTISRNARTFDDAAVIVCELLDEVDNAAAELVDDAINA